jgi:GNAT superfamily N-acetyltransferase
MKITRRQLRKLLCESINLASPMERMFLKELGATFYSEYDGARTGRGIFHDKFPNNCLVRFVLFVSGENTMFISDIETRGEDCQRKGYGRQVMEKLVAKADMFGITLELDAAPYSDTPLDVLYQFYTSVGFGPAGIDNHPYRMRRLPK